MYYNNLTINSGQALITAGFRIHVKGTLTLNSTSQVRSAVNNGTNGKSAYSKAKNLSKTFIVQIVAEKCFGAEKQNEMRELFTF